LADNPDGQEEMFFRHVFQQALHVILAEIGRKPAHSKISEAEIKQVHAAVLR
jgi:uncharacterized protein YneF (UPF0154 family)